MINKLKRIASLIASPNYITYSQSKGQFILPAHQGSSYVPLKVITSGITQITNTTAVGMVEISGSLNNAETKGVCWSTD